MSPDEREALLASVFSDDATPDDEAQLVALRAEDPALDQRADGLLVVHRLLAWRERRCKDEVFRSLVLAHLSTTTDDAFTAQVVARLQWQRQRVMFWSVAAAAVVMATILLWPRTTPPAAPVMAQPEPAVAPTPPAQPSHAAVTDRNETVQVHLPGGHTLTVAPDSRWRWDGSGGGLLEAGRAAVAVQPRQPGEDAFVLRTPDLQVRVLGTRFTLAVDDTGSLVRVNSGRVAVGDDAAASWELGPDDYAERRDGVWRLGRILDEGTEGLPWTVTAGPMELTSERRADGLYLHKPLAVDDDPEATWGTVEAPWMIPDAQATLEIRLRLAVPGQEVAWGVVLSEDDHDTWLALSQPLPIDGSSVTLRWPLDGTPIKPLTDLGDGRYDPAAVHHIALTVSGRAAGSIVVESLRTIRTMP